MTARRTLLAGLVVVATSTLTAGLLVVATGGPSTVPSAAAASRDALMIGGHGPAKSLDWAGYAVTGAKLTSAAGRWIQPAAKCTSTVPTQSAFWVGIDGYAAADPTVQQVGTDADCTKAKKQVYYAWYELYPGAIVPLSTATHPVLPGDTLSASVSGAGSTFTLSLTDIGRWTFSTVQVTPQAPLDSSAEWIAEAPTACTATTCKAVSLADFTTVHFAGASADGLPVNSTLFVNHQITMTEQEGHHREGVHLVAGRRGCLHRDLEAQLTGSHGPLPRTPRTPRSGPVRPPGAVRAAGSPGLRTAR